MVEEDISKSPDTSYNHLLRLKGVRVFRKDRDAFLVTHNKMIPRPTGTRSNIFGTIKDGLGIDLTKVYKKVNKL